MQRIPILTQRLLAPSVRAFQFQHPCAPPSSLATHIHTFSSLKTSGTDINELKGAEFVRAALEKHSDEILIFSKSFCPYCNATKLAMKMNSYKYQAYELDKRNDTSQCQEELGKITGGTSVPRVFVHGEFVGGADDTMEKMTSGEFEKLLNKSNE
eukprot:m.340389 g.340389  ORF g.340389 m.340389 type:complete len:155 (+) comp19263_c0_seq1:185-649(+)